MKNKLELASAILVAVLVGEIGGMLIANGLILKGGIVCAFAGVLIILIAEKYG